MGKGVPAVEFNDTISQLEASGRAVRDAYEHWQTELERRDELVVDALDQGVPQRKVAAAVGVSHQRVGRLTLPRADRQSA